MTEIDASKTISSIQGLISVIDVAVTQIVINVGAIGETSAKNTKWYKNQTGNLRKNTKFHLDGINSGALVANTGYAGYVQFGNRPKGLGKYIYPKRAQALRFVIAGQVIYAKRVRSHGPLPFMTDAASDMMHNAHSITVNTLSQYFNKFMVT